LPTYSRQAAKRLRRRGRSLARALLDQAYAEYLRGLTPRINNNNSHYDSNNDNNSRVVSVPSPPPPSPQLSSSNQLPSPPRSPIPPLEQPDSPHSVITSRIFHPLLLCSLLLTPFLLPNLFSQRATASSSPMNFTT